MSCAPRCAASTQRKRPAERFVSMETSTTGDTATIHSGWALARHNTLDIVIMATLGAVAGFVCARFLWT